ncbi:hypothetical protein MP638_000459 [Amoeboaphelidium occidentale]|nr:hypothetical protein MP638_000459 [Amoeboaphelidium occidentale]
MQQATIEDYLAYNPPTLVAAKKHTSHKTAFSSNPRTDDIELTKWESFAQNAHDYANAIRNQLAAHPMKVPLPQVTMTPYIRSEERYAELFLTSRSQSARSLDFWDSHQMLESFEVCTGLSQLPFMTAWLHIISLAVESHSYASQYTSPAMSRKMIKTGDPYTVQEVSLSDIYFTQAGPLNLVSRANIGSSKVHGSYIEKFHCELAAYKKLESLQGTIVSKLYGSFLASGFLYGLFLEPYGDEITQQIFEERKAHIKTLLVQIHSCGVAHGDIACRNIMVDAANKIKIIDFDSSYLQTDETDLEIWNEKVKADLDTFQ